MGVRNGLLSLLLILSLGACAQATAGVDIKRIALLAPFEGRYREIGYDALYAARLALNEAQATHIELLAVDDGGSINTARDRLLALHDDPLVTMVIGVGYAAAHADIQIPPEAHLPVLLVGYWDAQPTQATTWVLTSADIAQRITTAADISITQAASLTEPFTCAEVCALSQFTDLSPDYSQVTVISSAALPSADFIERYRQSDQFAPPPGLLATLTYDAMSIAIDASLSQANRAQVSTYLTETSFTGLNGAIRFADGYWANAPLHEYGYDDQGQLQAR